MPSGGRRSTTWKKGEPPPVKNKKGNKHKKTILKEKLGLQNWDGLQIFIEKEGATKLVKEMKKLHGKEFVTAFHSMTEFVKPKLQRVDAKIKAAFNLTDQDVTFE